MSGIEVARRQGVVTVTLSNRARKNAITPQMFREINDVARQIIASFPDDRAVILTGDGDDFSSGADLQGMQEISTHALPWMRQVGEACAALHAIPQPVIAKVRGVCVGAAANLALAADLVVADETMRFSEIFVRRGLSLDFGGSYVLPRLVGSQKAKELALLGDIISADDAARMGIVNRVVPSGELNEFVEQWAMRLALAPPLAMSTTKKLLNASFDRSLSAALEAEALGQSLNFETEDTAEAMKAFFEKRDGQFRGR